MFTALTIFLGLIGLGFLVFIHELGHYFVARRVGITVESFGIGFGRPIVKWKRKGVEWRIGWLLFGGYVAMAGMDKKGDLQPYEIAGGFYNAKPWSRIRVALAGPVVNIVFAFLLFCLIWATGGREKPFADFTQRVGWVDPESELYAQGVRPGDIINSYDGRTVRVKEDQLEAALLSSKPVEVGGYRVDYKSGQKTPFKLNIAPYVPPGQKEEIRFLGLMCPAEYLFADATEPFLEGSPLDKSALQPGDRLFWADGSLLFSNCQLQSLLKGERALITVERGGESILVRVPRVQLKEMRPTPDFQDELSDWHFATNLEGRLGKAYFIPYSVNGLGVVDGEVGVIDPDLRGRLFPDSPSSSEAPLQIGDRIIAVDGTSIASGEELLQNLQTHKVNLIVERRAQGWPRVSSKVADAQFDTGVDWANLGALTAKVGKNGEERAGDLILLKPIEPVTIGTLAAANPMLAKRLEEAERQIEKTKDLEEQSEKEALLERVKAQPSLGVNAHDRLVRYNPSPITLFGSVVAQVARTLKSLVVGDLHPKWLAGPVGIFQIMSYGWSVGFNEALYWLAVISLNLGLLNLLPIPILDGGHICFSVWEWITGKRIKAETRERWVIPFVVLLIGFFIFITYHDITRLVHQAGS